MLEEKHENFIAAVRKRRNASGHQGENERQPKKKKNGAGLHKGSFSLYSRQTTAKKCTKKCAALAKLLFC